MVLSFMKRKGKAVASNVLWNWFFISGPPFLWTLSRTNLKIRTECHFISNWEQPINLYYKITHKNDSTKLQNYKKFCQYLKLHTASNDTYTTSWSAGHETARTLFKKTLVDNNTFQNKTNSTHSQLPFPFPTFKQFWY